MKINVKVKKSYLGKLPEYKTIGSSGMDVSAAESWVLVPGHTRAISTGLYFDVPQGFEIQVRPRSGLALKNSVTVLNTPGTIDSDYRGELKVILINHGSENFLIELGDRIAQIVFCPIAIAELEEVQELSDTVRGDGGFGSTGIK